VDSCPKPNGKTLVHQFSKKLTDTQGFIARDDEKKEIVVALRGRSVRFLQLIYTNSWLNDSIGIPVNLSLTRSLTLPSYKCHSFLQVWMHHVSFRLLREISTWLMLLSSSWLCRARRLFDRVSSSPNLVVASCPKWAYNYSFRWNSVSHEVLDTVKTQLEAYPGYALASTGHSLGGALSSLAGISLKQNFPKR